MSSSSSSLSSCSLSSSDVVYLPRGWDDLHLHIRDTTPILSSTLSHLFPATTTTNNNNSLDSSSSSSSSSSTSTSVLKRALIMPNIIPPVTDVTRLKEYHERIIHTLKLLHDKQNKTTTSTTEAVAAAVASSSFTPLMSLYLTDDTSVDMITSAYESGLLTACKLYPQGATTHSHFGVKNIKNIIPALQKMADLGVLLLIHGESIDPEVKE